MDAKRVNGHELARAIGIVETNISNYRNAKQMPSGLILVDISHALKVRPEELMPPTGKTLPKREGEEATAYTIGGRRALDELEVLLRELRKRWEQQEHRLAHSARSSSDAVKSQEQTQKKKERKRRSTET